MTALSIDLVEARKVQRAATSGPWRLGPCTSCADVIVADVDSFEVCAPERPAELFAGDEAERDVRDAQADARFIATFDPSTVGALLDRLEAQDQAVGELELVVAFLAPYAMAFDGIEALMADCPAELRPYLSLFIQMRLELTG